MPEYRTFVPAEIDLSNKELRTRVQDELKNLLKAIRASVNVYPEDSPQHMQEYQIFQADKPQEVRLQGYPLVQKLVKSFIVDDVLKGGGRHLYEPKQIEQFIEGTKQFYEESTDLTTEGYYDVNVVSELGFGQSSQQVKEFLKDLGVVGQSGFSRDLREILRYFTGIFQDTGLNSISAVYKGRNPELHDILKSLPFLESVGEGRYILKLLTRPEDNKTIFLDATDLVPVYEKYMNVKPGATRTLPEQMQHIEDMKGTGTVRSMIDPSRQVQPLETQEQRDILRHLVHEYSTEGDRRKQRQEIFDPDYDPVLLENIAKKAKERKTVTFQPDSKSVSGKPKKVAKPSGTSPLAEKLRQRATAILEVENEKARQRLGIQPDDTEKPEKIPTKKPPTGGAGALLGIMPILEWARDYYDTGPKGIKRGGIIKSNQISLKDQMNKLTG